jgi:hypothetical protein
MPIRRHETLNGNPLHLVELDFVAGAVLELGRARTFMRGHGLGVFERAADLEICGHPVARITWQPSLTLKPASKYEGGPYDRRQSGSSTCRS